MTAEEAWETWIASPNLQAGSAVVGGLVGALLLLLFMRRVVGRITRSTETELDDLVAETVRLPLAMSLVAAGFWYASRTLTMPDMVSFVLGGTILTLTALYWARALSRGAGRMLTWLSDRQDQWDVVTPRTLPIFDIGAKSLIFVGTAYFVLLAWHVDVTGWLASAGIVGVAFGFASQDTLSNLIAGVFILADAPYKLGDYLVLDNGDRGEVVEIGIRTTRLMTRDDVEIIVPNKVMANARIVNQSGGPVEAFRVRVAVGVAYGSDIDQVHAELQRIAETTEGVRPAPPPRVRFRKFGDSSLDHEVMVWVDTPRERGVVTHRLLTTIYKRFAEIGVEIPYPKRDVYVHRADDT
ncbi:MAG: mechanosensitive ion channel family protein [Alphaproteobacteria bacterium]|nr:mechanosensitive ion channel family protein [Alphaproteobacteria bacterium]